MLMNVFPWKFIISIQLSLLSFYVTPLPLSWCDMKMKNYRENSYEMKDNHFPLPLSIYTHTLDNVLFNLTFNVFCNDYNNN